MIWVLVVVALLLLFLGPVIHLGMAMIRTDQETLGLGYYGKSPAERAEYKELLRRRAKSVRPMLRILGATTKFTFERASFERDGLRGPSGTCDPDGFSNGMRYQPRPEDVFVVTQMKCGTTWMQHVVYEVVMRGEGDLVDSGTALYAISPWLEGRKSVAIDDAPLVGDARPSRIIKTHFPGSHCPYDGEARYVYVARHPVSCYASSADFIRSNAGPLQPKADDIEAWFTSDAMWWGPWPDHVAGWWERAQREENVLFVRFEDMKADLPAVIRDVAEFLGLDPLSEDEVARIAHKCSFEYMRDHKDAFEMYPPHLFAVDEQMFVRGTADRHRDVDSAVGDRILAWCAEQMPESLPLDRLYPD